MSEHDLDQLLDSALTGYLAEPPAGLEDRVLRRARRPRIWPAAIGLAAAAIAVAYFVPAADPLAPPPLVAVHAPEARAVQLAPVAAPLKRRSGAVPLSKRERTLIQFARSNPELARQVLVEAPARMAEPLELQPISVAPITIEPLDSTSGGE